MDCEASARDLLEHMLLDTSAEPTDLPLSLLKSITNNFSDDLHIDCGGFAVVYKGILRNGTIAVKRLSQALDVDEKNFNQEISSLIRAKHNNIVRFLGYCADTQGKVAKFEGKMVIADISQRLLCFEFLPNGSLDKYIDAPNRGLDWRTRYQIIRGICEGLHYLHQHNIVHLDLKPANILMDYSMVPKIADFGLSKCFDEKQTRLITSKLFGSLGYMAPEFYSGVITFKSDIYSLGIIITEILTGQKGYLQIENVLESWSTMFQTSQGGTWLEHIRVCAEIGFRCMDSDPVKRPIIQHVIAKLNELENKYGFIGIENSTLVLDVHPLELSFPFEPNKRIECPVTLTNRTHHHVGIWITAIYPDACSSLGFPYFWEKRYCDDNGSTLFRKLEPHSSMDVYMIMKELQQPPSQAETGMFHVEMIATESEKALRELERYLVHGATMFKDVGTKVYRATLRAVTCDPAANCQEVGTHQFIQSREFGDILSIDVHPTETWVLVGYDAGYVSIWNYDTQETVMAFQVTRLSTNDHFWRSIYSTKFIAGKKWFAAGDGGGSVHVYAYTTKNKVKEFRAEPDCKCAHLLAVHPTAKLLLTASTSDKSIKLWDWGQGWTCTRVFDKHNDRLWYLTFGPGETNTFASSSLLQRDVKVWDIHSSDPIATFKGSRPTFYTDRHWHFLVTTDCDWLDNYHANIWDLQTKKHVHTLYHMKSRWPIQQVACHPTLPILATITGLFQSNEKCLYLWDRRTYRLKKRVELSMDGWIICMAFDGTEGLTRLVVASSEAISVIKINLPAPLTGGGN